MKTCNYRYCSKPIPEDIHKAYVYCPRELFGGKGCKAHEEDIRRKENARAKQILEKEITNLSRTLEMILGPNQEKNIHINRFMDLIYPLIHLFESKYVKESTVYFFKNVSMFKIQIKEEIFIKLENHEL